jgi:hypothetical protein
MAKWSHAMLDGQQAGLPKAAVPHAGPQSMWLTVFDRFRTNFPDEPNCY